MGQARGYIEASGRGMNLEVIISGCIMSSDKAPSEIASEDDPSNECGSIPPIEIVTGVIPFPVQAAENHNVGCRNFKGHSCLGRASCVVNFNFSNNTYVIYYQYKSTQEQKTQGKASLVYEGDLCRCSPKKNPRGESSIRHASGDFNLAKEGGSSLRPSARSLNSRECPSRHRSSPLSQVQQDRTSWRPSDHPEKEPTGPEYGQRWDSEGQRQSRKG